MAADYGNVEAAVTEPAQVNLAHVPYRPAQISASYAWCRALCRRSGSSFLSSFALLKTPEKNALYAIYAFARIADDLSDSSLPVATRRGQLDAWRLRSSRALQQQPATAALASDACLSEYEMLWPALTDTIDRYRIPHQLFDDLTTGVMMDLDHRQPLDWQELNTYCYRVASTVGLACTHIWRKSESLPRQNAIDCGIAFQLTNILRDVAEDAGQGRIYLPQCLLNKHASDSASWLAGEPNGNWLAVVDEVAAEAIRHYDSGWSTIEWLTPPSQRMFSLMWRGYRQLLTQIMREKQTLWNGHKPRLSRAANGLYWPSTRCPPCIADSRAHLRHELRIGLASELIGGDAIGGVEHRQDSGLDRVG